MLSIARKTALSGSAARIAQRSILIKPLVISPKKQQIRHQTNGSATAEKVYIYIYIFKIQSFFSVIKHTYRKPSPNFYIILVLVKK